MHAPRSPFWTGEFVASSCAAVALTLAPARGQRCTPDPFEPNDDCATAVTLPLGLHTGLTVPDGGADVFRVTVPAGQRLVATVSGSFQAWFRDSVSGAPGLHTSEALRVSFP